MSDAERFADIVIDRNATKDIALWAEISATDDSGVTVQGIKTGDVIEIQSVSGICSFSEQTGAAKVLSVIGFAGGVVASAAVGGKVGTAANIVKGQAGSIKTQMENSSVKSGGKRRDGYGRDVGGNNEFATKDGGIIVCMPSAHGPLYAGENMHLEDDAKQDGRLNKHVNKVDRDSNKYFFPCREKNGTMKMDSTEDGIIYILAFDSDYSDNAGSYEVRFRVILV